MFNDLNRNNTMDKEVVVRIVSHFPGSEMVLPFGSKNFSDFIWFE